MNWIHVSYFISMIITTVLMAGISWYSRKHRETVPGASVYMWISLLLSLLGIFDILQMLSPSAEIALIFFNLRFISFAFMPVLWIVFVFHFSGKPDTISKRIIAILCIIPVITQIIIWTDSLHGLWIIRNVEFIRSGFFLFADTSVRIPGVWQKIHNLYTYILLLAGIILLFYTSARMYAKQRGQALFLGIGTLIMVIGTLFPAFNLVPGMMINPMPQSFGLGSILIAWGMYRHRFLIEKPVIDKERKVPVLLILSFVLMTTGVITAGFINYRLYSGHHRIEVERKLTAIADLKVNDIIQWKKERIGDGNLLSGNPAFSNLVKRFVSDSSDTNSRMQIYVWLDKIRTSYQYRQIYLTDNNGNVVLSIPRNSEKIKESVLKYINDSRQTGGVILTDLHRMSPDKPIHLSVIAPINDGYNRAAVTGYAVLVIDPEVYLYPNLKRWPDSSKTAETLIVRRDGDDVLFLNELKFIKNTALNLRVPISNRNLPPVMAVLGHEGLVEGIDYRGVHVSAAVQSIPGTPWHLIARVDMAELYGPVNERFWIMIVVILGFIGTAGTGIGLIWRKRSDSFYREKYEAAEELRESEEKFSNAFRTSSYSITITDPASGQIVDFNNAFCTISGYTKEDVLNHTTIALNLWVDEEERNYVVRELMEGRTVENREFKFRKKNGDIIIGIFSAGIIKTKKGTLILSSINDVSERKKAEKELELQLNLLTALINSPKDLIIFSLDKSYSYTAFNEKHREEMKLVWNADVNIGTNLLECMSIPEIRELAKKSIDRALDGERFTEIQHQPGPDIYYEFSWNPIFENKIVIGATVFIRNITESKIMEDLLKGSKNELQQLIQSMTAAFVLFESVFDESGNFVSYRFVYINEAYENITGVKNDEVKGKTVFDVWPDTETEWITRYGEVAITGIPQTFDLYHEHTSKYYHCNVYRPGDTRDRFCVVFEDITPRINAERELKYFAEELERSNIELQQFAYVASHDLQEPLRMISSYLQLIERRYKDKLDSDANDFINFAVEGANRLQSLIVGLLEYSRVNTLGKPFVKINLKDILEAVLRDLELQIRDTQTVVEIGELPVVLGDDIQMLRLFQNLILNGIKFRREGLNPEIKISCKKNGNEYIFCVRDNGIGIEKEYFETIFIIFQRLHTRDKYPGTGIGLSICQKIVERHGGKMWIESKLGEGSSFYFTIPEVIN